MGLRGVGRFHRDARLFLVTTFVAGAALSLYWIDFNLYLASLGLSTATIGFVSTIASVAGATVAFPASAASDRFGRRTIIAAGISIGLVAIVGLLLTQALPLIVLFAALWAVGQQSFQVVQAPFLTEHSEPEHRNDLFAVQFAIQNATNVAAAMLGGVGAVAIARIVGLDPAGPGTYRVILVLMAVLLTAALATVAFLTDRGSCPERASSRSASPPRFRRILAAREPGSESSFAIAAGSPDSCSRASSSRSAPAR